MNVRPLDKFSAVNPENVAKMVAGLRSIKDDSEAAHVLEDEIRQWVLMSISLGTCFDPVECSRLAITTGDIHFERYCA